MLTNKYTISSILDKIILTCLFLYTLTFLLDLKINFLTTAFAFGIIKLFFNRPKIEVNTKLFYFIAAFLFFTFIPIFLNDVASVTSYNLSQYRSRFISPLIGILMIFVFEFTPKRIAIILSGFSISLFINAFALIYQFIMQNASIHEFARPVGFASNYMLLGAINLLILPIIFALAINKTSLPQKIRFFLLATTIINIPAVIFANTRITYIGIAVSFLLIIVLSLKTKKQILSAIAMFLLSIFIVFQISPGSVDRLESIPETQYENQSNSERILMWTSAIKMFEDHPIFGVGVGNYHDQYMNNYRSPLARENQWHPHNVLLNMLTESGIFGGITLIALFVYIYYTVIKAWLKTKNPYYLAYLSSLIAYNVIFLTDSMFCGHNIKSPTTIFWLFTGIYFIVSQKIKITYKENF